MGQAGFITRPLSLWLDLVRGLAATAVVIGHGAQLGVYTGPYPFTIAFQHNAVITFFVVSGIVIAGSVDGRRVTLFDYALARISRILPVALPALLFAVLVATLDAQSPAPLFAEDAGGVPPGKIAFALLFLSESYQSSLSANPAYWSLCYEVWYYALFGAATFLEGRSRVLWLLVLAAFAGPNALLLLPVWLAGVWAARSTWARQLRPELGSGLIALACFGLYMMPLLAPPLHIALRVVAPWILGYSLYAPTDFLLGACLALGFVGLRAISADEVPLLARCAGPIRFMANISFSLYLVHWPLLKLLRMAGMPPATGPLAFAAIIALVIAVSAAYARLIEYRRYAIRDALARLLGAGRRAPEAA